eukprot:jgi/Mesvir1/24677/Mv25138-RA.1
MGKAKRNEITRISFVTGLLAVYCFMSAALGAAVGDGVALRVLTTTPLVDRDDPSLSVSGDTPITVVFNRAVIRLGSDYGNDVDLDAVPTAQRPFAFNPPVKGRFRWVTTYIARFDPLDGWMPDVETTLVWNGDLTTWDGVSILDKDVPPNVRITTPSLTMWAGNVESPTASNLTDNLWSAHTATKTVGVPEFPPDGRMEIYFSGVVSVAAIKQAIKVVNPSGSRVGTLDVVPCTSQQAYVGPGRCVLVSFLTGGPGVDQQVTIQLPAGTDYNPGSGAGRLRSTTSIPVSGLRPFVFPFRTFYGNDGPSFRNYDLWLRHGLENPSAALDNLAALISVVETKTNAPLAFTLELVHKGKLRVNAPFLPGREYRLTVSAATPARPVKDGFGLSLQGSTVTFTPFPTPTFFTTPPGFVLFEAGTTPASWPIFAKGDTLTVSGSRDDVPISIKGIPVALDERSVLDAIATVTNRWYNSAHANESSVSAPLTDSLEVLELKTAPLLAPGGMAMRQHCCDRSYDGTLVQQGTELMGETGVGAGFIVSGEQVTVWVTRLENPGAPVQGAVVTLYISAGSASQVIKVGQATTGADGVAIIRVTEAIRQGNYYGTYVASVSYVNAAAVPRMLLFPDVPRTWTPTTTELRGRLVSDLRLFRSGDNVHLKGFVRLRQGTELQVPSSEKFFLQVAWPTGGGGDSNQLPTQVPVDLSRLGTFNASLAVPAGTSSGQAYIYLLRRTGEDYVSPDGLGVNPRDDDAHDTNLGVVLRGEGIASLRVTVADPRPPTVTLELTSTDRVVPGTPVQVKVSTETYTGAPVANAEVYVTWKLTRPSPPRFDMYWFRPYRPGVSTDAVDFMSPAEGEVGKGMLVAITGADGTATVTLDAALTALAPKDGDELRFEASWVGPTSELLTKSLPIPVSTYPWEVETVLTTQDPLPGYSFGVRVNVRTVVTQEDVTGASVTVRLRAKGATSPLAECSTTADGGRNVLCLFALPSVGKFLLTACAQYEGGDVCSVETSLGKSEAEWAARPLESLSGISMVPSAATYRKGDVVQLSFVSPWPGDSGARALLQWGSSHSPLKTKTVALADVTVTTNNLPTATLATDPLGDECLGGCTLFVLLAVPRLSSPPTLPADIPLSALFDAAMPFSAMFQFPISVPDGVWPVDVSLNVLPEAGYPDIDNGMVVLAPGSTASITVSAGESGEAVLFVVDKAMLDLVANPREDLTAAFALSSSASFAASHSNERLVAPGVMPKIVETVQRRQAREPWLHPETWEGSHLQLHPTKLEVASLDVPDDDYLGRFASCLTEIPYCESYRGRVDDYYGPGGVESETPSTADAGMGAGSPPPSIGESARPPAAASSTPTVRINFQRTPLFVGALTLSPATNNAATVTFKVPDGVGQYVVRAYVAAASGTGFGAVEQTVTVRLPLNLVTSGPRVVRLGDAFEAGVVMTAFAPTGSPLAGQPIPVALSAAAQGTVAPTPGAPSDKSAAVVPGGPAVETRFWFTAGAALGGANLTFTALSQLGNDSVQLGVPVLPHQDAVFLATSMALQAASSQATVWDEGMALPAAVPGSGSLMLAAGVNKLPAIKLLSSALLTPPPYYSQPGGTWTISSLVPSVVLALYPSSGIEPLLADATRQHADSLDLLAGTLTKPCCGLVEWPYGWNPSYPDARLNAYGVYVLQTMQRVRTLAGSTAPQPDVELSLVATWRDAADRAMVSLAADARHWGSSAFGDLELLATVRLALGLRYAFASNSAVLMQDLSMERVDDAVRARGMTMGGLAAAALAHVEDGDTTSDVVSSARDQLLSCLRVTSRSAYISAAPGAAASAGTHANALALSLFLRLGMAQGDTQQLVAKLSMHVASGTPAGYGGFIELGGEPAALAAFSLAEYDATVGSSKPYVALVATTTKPAVPPSAGPPATSGTPQVVTVLLDAAFTPSNMSVQQQETAWSDTLGDSISFSVSGTGRVDVAAGMRFVPAAVSVDPIYRGLFVERTYRRVSAATGQVEGPELSSEVEKGAIVEVTVQVTSPDDLGTVIVDDLVPGGLEPMDPNVASGLTPLPNCGSYSPGVMGGYGLFLYYFWWSCPVADTRVDGVRFTFARMGAGTHSVAYRAVAATSGTFVLPPAKAYAKDQPEVMGLSRGGNFSVTARERSAVDARNVQVSAALLEIAPAPRACPGQCSGAGYCNLATGRCTCDAGFDGDDCTVVLNEVRFNTPMSPPPPPSDSGAEGSRLAASLAVLLASTVLALGLLDKLWV